MKIRYGSNENTTIRLWASIAWITFLFAWAFAFAWLFTAFFTFAAWLFATFFAFAAWFFIAFFLTFTFASALFFIATFGATIIRFSHRLFICNGIHPKNFGTGRSWTLLSLSTVSFHSIQRTSTNWLWCGKRLNNNNRID